MLSLFIGLMSGTSLDGVDGVLVDFADDDAPALRVLAPRAPAASMQRLRAELLALNTARRPTNCTARALAGNALGARLRGRGAGSCCSSRDVPRHAGARDRRPWPDGAAPPGEFDGIGYTLQLLNGALLAELTGIDVVADFRSRDVAAGGQGAPLVPAFHPACFARAARRVAVLNLGGIANLTLLRADGRRSRLRLRPGQRAARPLVPARHRGAPYRRRRRAGPPAGTVDAHAAAALLAEPYFAAQPPKSTGRDLFNAAWLDAQLARAGRAAAPADVQATLAELTARAAPTPASSS